MHYHASPAGGMRAATNRRLLAVSLGITRKSVENHKQRIFAKLGVQSQANAVAVAVGSGLLDPAAQSRHRRTG